MGPRVRDDPSAVLGTRCTWLELRDKGLTTCNNEYEGRVQEDSVILVESG